MNQAELVAHAAKAAGVTNKQAEAVISAVSQATTDALKSGDPVRLAGLGILKAVAKPEREARNPRTGETVKVPARKAVKLTASKALTEALNAA